MSEEGRAGGARRGARERAPSWLEKRQDGDDDDDDDGFVIDDDDEDVDEHEGDSAAGGGRALPSFEEQLAVLNEQSSLEVEQALQALEEQLYATDEARDGTGAGAGARTGARTDHGTDAEILQSRFGEHGNRDGVPHSFSLPADIGEWKSCFRLLRAGGRSLAPRELAVLREEGARGGGGGGEEELADVVLAHKATEKGEAFERRRNEAKEYLEALLAQDALDGAAERRARAAEPK